MKTLILNVINSTVNVMDVNEAKIFWSVDGIFFTSLRFVLDARAHSGLDFQNSFS
jgi:hypothetical protein